MNPTASASRPAPPQLGIPLTEEQKQAIMDVAGRREDDLSMELWMEEIRKFRERLRQEEIARQDESEPTK